MNPSPWFAFEDSNHLLVAPVRERLVWLCANRVLHARFLNMLSLLEHIGSRKIMKCQAMREPGNNILKHLAEETRHALFFKRAAERLAHRPMDYSESDTLAHGWARFYMDRLDAEIAHALADSAPALPYLYMSLIVELRAVWTYRLYQLVLMEHKVAVPLKAILAEEELHLRAMLTYLKELDPRAEQRVAAFSDFEQMRFRSLWSGIEEECARLRLAAE